MAEMSYILEQNSLEEEESLQIREITYMEIALRIVIAAILGGAIGLERGLKNRPAGLRTYMLVCSGACLIMMTNQYIYQVFQTGDPVRMGAQVVSGIGFLGAGTIAVTKHNQVKGLTTAAGLWASAALGLAVGIGFYEAAVLGWVTVFIIMTGLHRLDDRMHRSSKVMEVYVELNSTMDLSSFMRGVRELGMAFDSVYLAREKGSDYVTQAFIAILRSPKRFKHQKMLDRILEIDGVLHLEEL